MSVWGRIALGWGMVVGFCGCMQDPHGHALDVLQNASELAAAEFVLGKVIIADQQLDLLHHIPLNSATFFADSEAVLVTGVDLSRLQPEHIEINGNSIRLELPPVQVLMFRYPPDRCRMIHRYSHLHAPGNRIDAEALNRILQDAQTQIMSAVNHLPVQETTELKVANAVRALLRKSGFIQVEIGFSPTEEALFTLPDTSMTPTKEISTS